MQSWVNVLYAVTIPISLLYELGTNRVQSPFAKKAANGFESMSWLFNAYDRCIGIVSRSSERRSLRYSGSSDGFVIRATRRGCEFLSPSLQDIITRSVSEEISTPLSGSLSSLTLRVVITEKSQRGSVKAWQSRLQTESCKAA